MNEFRVLQPLLPSRISVVVATFGDTEWAFRGLDRALQTHMQQSLAPEVIWVHDETLAKARNFGAGLSTGEWLVFLDADDLLEAKFCDALDAAVGEADIYQTSVWGFNVRENVLLTIEPKPVFHEKSAPLIQRNYLIIGSPVRKKLFEEIEGFDEYPVLEDWALWLKAQKARATFGECREAVYMINDDHKRNFQPVQFEVAQQIRERYR